LMNGRYASASLTQVDILMNGHETREIPSSLYSLDLMEPLDFKYLEDLPAIELAPCKLIAEIDTSGPNLVLLFGRRNVSTANAQTFERRHEKDATVPYRCIAAVDLPKHTEDDTHDCPLWKTSDKIKPDMELLRLAFERRLLA
jgi:hypothetical protein